MFMVPNHALWLVPVIRDSGYLDSYLIEISVSSEGYETRIDQD